MKTTKKQPVKRASEKTHKMICKRMGEGDMYVHLCGDHTYAEDEVSCCKSRWTGVTCKKCLTLKNPSFEKAIKASRANRAILTELKKCK